ncbi:hypothetical protein Y046_3821 [Burkholderia pseudomallei MSHR2990]|nr:hypothetical protein Y046_3821 [Burkholderia pseudomallei MSHR2990]
MQAGWSRRRASPAVDRTPHRETAAGIGPVIPTPPSERRAEPHERARRRPPSRARRAGRPPSPAARRLEPMPQPQRDNDLIAVRGRRQRPDRRVERRNAVAAAHALIDGLEIRVRADRERVIGLRDHVIPLRTGFARARVEAAHRVRVRRREAQPRRDDVAPVEREIVEDERIAVELRDAAALEHAAHAVGGRMGPRGADRMRPERIAARDGPDLLAAARDRRRAVRRAQRAVRVRGVRIPIDSQIAGAEFQRAVRIGQARAPRRVVAERARRVREAVHCAEGPSAVCRARVLDRVVDADVAVRVVVVVRVNGEVAAPAGPRRAERRDEIQDEVVLAAERERAPFLRFQSDPCLPTEHVDALLR